MIMMMIPFVFGMIINYFSHGARNTWSESKKETVLHGAVKNGKIDVVEFLLKQNLDVNVVNDKGNTPLQCAIDIV